MAIIQLAVALIILTILYRRMIQRESPAAIEKAQAIVPVLLGVLSTPLSFVFFLGIGLILLIAGFNAEWMPAVPRSILAAFIQAGFPEETAKLLLLLLSLRIFHAKIKNVYEYILMGAAIGFGFTLFEEFIYGSGDIISGAGRLITVAGHMIFGVIMAKHLGIARYIKLNGEGSAAGEYAKAVLIPIAIHTLYDACTADNKLMASEDDMLSLIGILFSIASIIVLFILQFKVLGGLKKDAEKYCGMELLP